MASATPRRKRPSRWRGALAAIGLLTLAMPVSRADFAAALSAYQGQRWDEAARGFRALAELGHAEAQYNLGVMYLRGEGVPRSEVQGYAWAKLAMDAGHTAAAGIIDEMRPLYGEDAASLIEDLDARFGQAAIRAGKLPEILPNCEYSTRTPARLLHHTNIGYPPQLALVGAEGWLAVDFLVAPDGTSRDYVVLSSNHPEAWRGVAERVMRDWRWTPAMRDGEPIWSRSTVVFKFDMYDSDITGIDRWLAKVKEKADAGDPLSQYLYGIVLISHPHFNRDRRPENRRTWSDALPWVQRSAMAGFALAEYNLGMSLLEGRGCTADRDKALYWLQRAAARGVPEAQYMLALELIERPVPVSLTDTPIDLLRRASGHKHRSSSLALAKILATQHEATPDSAAEALDLSSMTLKANKNDPSALEARAAALAAAGRFNEAVAHQRRALSLASERGWSLAPLQARLQAYERGEPWRGALDW